MGYLVVELDGAIHLLSRGGRPTLDKLYQLALSLYRQEQDPTTVLLLQNGPAQAFSHEFIKEIRLDTYLDELRFSVYKLRFICRAMIKSSSRWIYCCHEDCLSTFAELAMACDHFISFRVPINFGFPEIRARIFPLAGVFERAYFRSHKLMEQWETKPVRLLDEAGTIGPQVMIHAEDWIDSAKNWVESHSFPTKEPFKGPDVLLDFYLDCLDRLPPLQSELESADHWSSALLRLKRSQDRLDTARWMVDSSACFLFTNYFMRTVEKPRVIPAHPARVFNEQVIYLDVNQRPAPVVSLVSLLEHGWSVVIIASQRSKLKRSLDSLYKGVERQGQPRLLDLWRHQVTWAEKRRQPYMDWVAWQDDGTLSVSILGQTWSALTLSEERNRSITVEMRRNESFDQEFLEICGFRMILSPGETYLSDFLRSWALEELIRVSSGFRGGIEQILKLAKDYGWRFLASTEMWESFLTVRSKRDVCSSLGGKVLDSRHLAIGSWRDVKVESTRNQGQEPQLYGENINLHFEMFAMLMFATVKREFQSDAHQDIGVLIGASLGMPYGSCLPHLSHYDSGVRRPIYYLEQNWPECCNDIRDHFC
ncbi:hypothetical protein EDD56_101168 [Pseudobacteriovorax antillogorgiicola]|nr:hypothetical protein EDD56_101168 [Pseudobacteriovorax antillogorgiicola]